ncbi:MAG: hypothetical protein WC291_00130 [Thermodesulfovibrionales bacterium]
MASPVITESLFAEILKIGLAAIAGGVITALGSMPVYNNRITKLTTEVEQMKSGCSMCKSAVDRTIEKMTENITAHHIDSTIHNNAASSLILNDILTRVMRIETRLLTTPHQQSEQ